GEDRLGGGCVRDRAAGDPLVHLRPHQEDQVTQRRLGVTVVRGVLLAIVAAGTIFPIYYMVSLAITPWSDLFRPVYVVKHPTLDNFKCVLLQESPFVKFFWRWLANSLLVSTAVMLAVLAVASLGSYALARIRFGLGRYCS